MSNHNENERPQESSDKNSSGKTIFNKFTVLTKLVQALVWPLVVLAVVWLLKGPILNLIDQADVSVSAGDFAIDLKRTKEFVEKASKGEEISSIEFESLTGLSISKENKNALSQARILWVDDEPFNNRYVILALEALGTRITNAISTDEAIFFLSNAKFDVVISDMCRQRPRSRCGEIPIDQLDGYVLMQEMQDLKPLALLPPILIYAAYDGDEKTPYREIRKQSRARGAYAQTNRPIELIQLAIQIITK